MSGISKRESGAWQNTSYGIRATAMDTITTLPTTIYGDGTNATVGIKGNAVQSGTPTPNNPIIPQGCGELEAGQYKIPISSANTTTPVYLGEVETTRKIKKLVLTGEEDNWKKSSVYQGSFYNALLDTPVYTIPILCSHAVYIQQITPTTYVYGKCTVDGSASIKNLNLFIGEPSWSVSDFQQYLAFQYAAGTPVCVWYVLANEETAVVNEPLMRIGDYYADEVSGVSIPTTDGANTLSVDTTVQPSEVDINYHGWHMGTVHERTSGQWD